MGNTVFDGVGSKHTTDTDPESYRVVNEFMRVTIPKTWAFKYGIKEGMRVVMVQTPEGILIKATPKYRRKPVHRVSKKRSRSKSNKKMQLLLQDPNMVVPEPLPGSEKSHVSLVPIHVVEDDQPRPPRGIKIEDFEKIVEPPHHQESGSSTDHSSDHREGCCGGSGGSAGDKKEKKVRKRPKIDKSRTIVT